MNMKFMKVVNFQGRKCAPHDTRFTPTAQSKTLMGPSSLEVASRFGGVSPTAKVCSGPGSDTSWRNGRHLMVSAHASTVNVWRISLYLPRRRQKLNYTSSSVQNGGGTRHSFPKMISCSLTLSLPCSFQTYHSFFNQENWRVLKHISN